MDIFDVLTLIGGLCLFLFGMNIMGAALERSAGGKLELMIGKFTTGKIAGFLTGLVITSVIQSSSATTVMVVGFVNSGLMTLRQAIHVIIGANVGTTVTAWVLSLGDISGEASLILKLLKPSSFTPILALIGIALYMFTKSNKKRDVGTILLGFAVLMFGMETMSGSVVELQNQAWFTNLFVAFESNPILGVLVGAGLTAVIQSSSASVGILQALSKTGAVSYGAAFPIIMGQNIGTCVTALLSSIGTNKNAKRAATVHLVFNIFGTILCLIVFYIVRGFIGDFLGTNASMLSIAIINTSYKCLISFIFLPISSLLEKLACKIIPDAKLPEKVSELDERLLATPTIALERAHDLTLEMASIASGALRASIDCLSHYDKAAAQSIREAEDRTDHFEDIIGSYLVKISTRQLNDREGALASMLLKAIGDFERISDHAVNILESAEEIRDKGIVLSDDAKVELSSLSSATLEIVDLAEGAFETRSLERANLIEPLEQVIDKMKELLRTRHIERLRVGNCGIEAGFVWSDLITNMERVADHCSNIAGCVIDIQENNMNLHESLKLIRTDSEFYFDKYHEYKDKYITFIK